jgi:hypothetical protein
VRRAKPNASGPEDSGLASNNFVFGGDPLSVQQLLNPFPGFGFDFEHLAALHRDDDIKAFIDPATQVRLALAERRLRRSHRPNSEFFFLDGGGAYALPIQDDSNSDVNATDQAPAAGDAQPQSAQQPIIIIQQPAAQQPGAQQESADARNAMQPQEEAAPLPDVGEFTLVLRGGGKIETVAFTRVNDKIVYITSEGGRRTLAIREIDIDATIELNQERGTPLQLPL